MDSPSHPNPFDQFLRDILRQELLSILNPILDAKRPINATPVSANKLAVTAERAAEMISVSRSTFDRLVKRGLIHPVKATRKPIYAITELQRFLDETSQPIDP